MSSSPSRESTTTCTIYRLKPSRLDAHVRSKSVCYPEAVGIFFYVQDLVDHVSAGYSDATRSARSLLPEPTSRTTLAILTPHANHVQGTFAHPGLRFSINHAAFDMTTLGENSRIRMTAPLGQLGVLGLHSSHPATAFSPSWVLGDAFGSRSRQAGSALGCGLLDLLSHNALYAARSHFPGREHAVRISWPSVDHPPTRASGLLVEPKIKASARTRHA
jgi:hypothetical protein